MVIIFSFFTLRWWLSYLYFVRLYLFWTFVSVFVLNIIIILLHWLHHLPCHHTSLSSSRRSWILLSNEIVLSNHYWSSTCWISGRLIYSLRLISYSICLILFFYFKKRIFIRDIAVFELNLIIFLSHHDLMLTFLESWLCSWI